MDFKKWAYVFQSFTKAYTESPRDSILQESHFLFYEALISFEYKQC